MLPAFLAASLLICLGGASFSSLGQSTGSVETPYVKCWEYQLASPLISPSVANNGTVFLAESEGRLRAIDSTTGLTKWSAELGGEIISNVVFANSRIYAATGPTGANKDSGISYLRIVNPSSGIPEKSIELPFSNRVFIGWTEGSIVSIDETGSVVALNHNTLEPVWRQRLNSDISAPPSFSASSAAIALSDGRVIVLSGYDGSTVLLSRWVRKILAIAVGSTQMLMVGDDRGNVVRFGDGNPRISWKFKSGAAVATISISGDHAIVTSRDNFVYLIDPESGNVRWRKRLAGRGLYPPMIEKDRLIAPTFGERVVPILDLFTGKMINKIELGENAYPLQMPQLTGAGSIVIVMPGAITAFGQNSCVAE